MRLTNFQTTSRGKGPPQGRPPNRSHADSKRGTTRTVLLLDGPQIRRKTGWVGHHLPRSSSGLPALKHPSADLGRVSFSLRRGKATYSEGGRPASASYLKSLSLDVIFSSRLEMWYEALAMMMVPVREAFGRLHVA